MPEKLGLRRLHWELLQFSRRTAFLLLLTAAACNRRSAQVVLPPPIPATPGFTETGVASWYGHPYHGRRTSNGEVYDMDQMTAAHLRLPFGTVVRVENLDNGRTVEVRINDRGPFVKSRILDLSREAARRLEMIGPGTARVRIEVLSPPDERPREARAGPPRSTPQGAAQRPPLSEPPCGRAFAVQVGAFRDRANATALQTRAAEAATAELRILEAEDEQGTLYRVTTAPTADFAAARRLRDELFSTGIDGFITEIDTNPSSPCETE